MGAGAEADWEEGAEEGAGADWEAGAPPGEDPGSADGDWGAAGADSDAGVRGSLGAQAAAARVKMKKRKFFMRAC